MLFAHLPCRVVTSVGIVQQIGFYLVKAGGALIDNMAILFAIGIGVGMSEDNDGTGGLAALASWLMLTTLLSVGAVSVIKTLEEAYNRLHSHSARSRTRSSVSSQVLSVLPATINSKEQSCRTGCHSSAANVA